jgi:hypothetical protein
VPRVWRQTRTPVRAVQVIGQLAAERVRLLRDQLAEDLLLLLVRELGHMPATMRTRLDAAFCAVALPHASRRSRRTGHDLGHVIAFQATLKQLDDPSSHRQRERLHPCRSFV